MLENKNEEENSRDDTRDRRENTNRCSDGEDIICKIKVDSLTFHGVLDPKIFSDWMVDVDY